jgi:hypothetical protein
MTIGIYMMNMKIKKNIKTKISSFLLTFFLIWGIFIFLGYSFIPYTLENYKYLLLLKICYLTICGVVVTLFIWKLIKLITKTNKIRVGLLILFCSFFSCIYFVGSIFMAKDVFTGVKVYEGGCSVTYTPKGFRSPSSYHIVTDNKGSIFVDANEIVSSGLITDFEKSDQLCLAKIKMYYLPNIRRVIVITKNKI